MEADLAYEPLTESETKAARSIFHAVLTNTRIMDIVDDFHDAGVRCAVIIAQKTGIISEIRVCEQPSVTKEFPFNEIAGTIANYDTQKQVCIVLVRDSDVCSVLIGRGAPPKEN